jgi:uncharacterized protein (DUF4415 family)
MNDIENKVIENTTEESARRGRGRGANPALAHVNLRLPHEVLEFYRKYPHYTQKMREVLTKFIYTEEQKKELLEKYSNKTYNAKQE